MPTATRIAGARRVVGVQALIALLAGMAVLGIQGWNGGRWAAASVVYGGAVACANTLLLIWRLRRCEKHSGLDAGRQLRLFYLSSLERFLVVAALLVMAMVALGLSPLVVAAGFVLGQLTLLVAGFMGGIK